MIAVKLVISSITATTTKNANQSRQRGNAHGKNKKKCAIPQYELEALAEVLFPTMKDYLSSPEGKAEFQKWQGQQTEKFNNGTKRNEG